MFHCCHGITKTSTPVAIGAMSRLDGKISVVTGASSGIGAATAKLLARHGSVVVGLARGVDKIQELGDELVEESGTIHALKCDITKEEDVKKAFEWIKINMGSIDFLINNAGLVLPSSLIDGSTENWKEIISVNMLGLCICTREALKLMKENNNGGHIININSITGHYIPLLPEPVLNIYPATKFAVTALSETLRRELTFAQRKIKVTSLSPGLVKTAWFNGLTPNIKITLSKPEMPVLKPEDVADTIAFILSTPPFVEV